MGGEHHVGAVGEGVDGLGEIARPGVRVAHQRTAQCEQVVQIVGGVLGHAQRAELREVEVHLGGRLGAGRHLEFDLDTVDGQRLTRGGDVDGRHDDGDLTGGGLLAQAATHLALRTAFEQGPVHVGGAAGHRGAGVDVLLHRVLDEPFRRDHRDLAGVDIGLGGDTEYAAEVVHVAVGVDHGGHRTIPAVGAVQRERRGCGLGADQRVDDDDAGVALDEADVRQVQTADLVDALDDLVEALLGARMDCRHRLGCTDAGASPARKL